MPDPPSGVVAVCPAPVFIIGAPRSGTSILAWSLAQHGAFRTWQETDILHYLFGDARALTAYELAARRGDESWLVEQGVSRDEFLRALGLGVNALFTSRSPDRRWIDSTPSYTLMADVLAVMFPGAAFLHILRDGREVVHSMIHSGFPEPWAEDFREACRAWSVYVEHARGFAARHPTRSLTVRHDRLVGDPDGEFARILAFLDTRHDETPARFFRSTRINSSFGSTPAADAPALWQGWGGDRRAAFLEEAGATLVSCEYASAEDLGPGTRTRPQDIASG